MKFTFHHLVLLGGHCKDRTCDLSAACSYQANAKIAPDGQKIPPNARLAALNHSVSLACGGFGVV